MAIKSAYQCKLPAANCSARYCKLRAANCEKMVLIVQNHHFHTIRNSSSKYMTTNSVSRPFLPKPPIKP
jgi:hypothetical protein